MKQRISIVLDEETLELVEKALESRTYRNRSHAIELILNQALNGKSKGVE